MTVSRLIFLEWEMFQTNVEKTKTHFSFNNFFSENRAVYEINVKKYVRTRQATEGNMIRRMRFARWVTKATDTHTHNI
jgi:hypothetical protein